MNNLVLVVKDDFNMPLPRHDIEHLKANGYRIVDFSNYDTVTDYFEKNPESASAVIVWSRHLYSPRVSPTESHSGLPTGLSIYQEIRKMHESVPIILLYSERYMKRVLASIEDSCMKGFYTNESRWTLSEVTLSLMPAKAH